MENHFDKTDVKWSQWEMIEGLYHVIIIKYHTSGTKFCLKSKVTRFRCLFFRASSLSNLAISLSKELGSVIKSRDTEVAQPKV